MEKALEWIAETTRQITDWRKIPHMNEEERIYDGTHEGRHFTLSHTSISSGNLLHATSEMYQLAVPNGEGCSKYRYGELRSGNGAVYQHSSCDWIKSIYERAQRIAEENNSSLTE